MQTDRAKWAIKRPFEPQDEQEEEPNAAFAELVFAQGITTPATVRTPEGRLFAEVDGQQFRAYGWVDIAGTDPGVDPVLVGSWSPGCTSIERAPRRSSAPLVHRPGRHRRLVSARRTTSPTHGCRWAKH